MAVGFAEFNLEEFRARIAKMNDAELLRYGQAVRSACSPEALQNADCAQPAIVL